MGHVKTTTTGRSKFHAVGHLHQGLVHILQREAAAELAVEVVVGVLAVTASVVHDVQVGQRRDLIAVADLETEVGDAQVVHDLAYADIVYDGWKAPSIMQVPGARDVAVEFFTLSKSYNMAGWRIGFMVGNKTLVNALARIKSYHDYGTFTPLQVAAIAALEGDQQCVRDIAEQYKRRRDVLVKGLHEAGWMVECPKASMYVWAKIPEPYAAMGSLEFAKKLLNEAKVCVSPGIGFGDYGDTHVRFALIENRDRTRQAIRGIKAMFRADGLLASAS